MSGSDPFVLPPKLWFGLLCEGLLSDQRGRLNFQAVFNQIQYFDTPEQTGVPPHAALQGILALGFTSGLGHFKATIEIRNVDGETLWTKESPWEFDIGPGDSNAAVLAQRVMYWFTQPGRYHFWIRLEPTGDEYEIPFEAGRQIGPASVDKPDQAPPQ